MKVKSLVFVCLIAVMAACVFGSPGVLAAKGDIWDGSTAAGFDVGDGSADDPYEISDGAQLAFFSQRVNAKDTAYNGKNYLLTADIVLNDTQDWENWQISPPANMWTPIGTSYNTPFRGTFDGGGHKISGIYIDTIVNYQGLFGYVDSGTLMNLGVTDSCIKGRDYVGGVAGYVGDHSTVIDCYNTGNISGAKWVGGVAGYAYDGTVTGCYNMGAVSGSDYVGGVAGRFILPAR